MSTSHYWPCAKKYIKHTLHVNSRKSGLSFKPVLGEKYCESEASPFTGTLSNLLGRELKQQKRKILLMCRADFYRECTWGACGAAPMD